MCKSPSSLGNCTAVNLFPCKTACIVMTCHIVYCRSIVFQKNLQFCIEVSFFRRSILNNNFLINHCYYGILTSSCIVMDICKYGLHYDDVSFTRCKRVDERILLQEEGQFPCKIMFIMHMVLTYVWLALWCIVRTDVIIGFSRSETVNVYAYALDLKEFTCKMLSSVLLRFTCS